MEPRETEGRKQAKNNLVRVPSGSCLPRYRSSSSSSSITPMPAAFQAGDRASFFLPLLEKDFFFYKFSSGLFFLLLLGLTCYILTSFSLSLSKPELVVVSLTPRLAPQIFQLGRWLTVFEKGPTLSLSGFHSFFLSALEDRERKRQRNNFMQL